VRPDSKAYGQGEQDPPALHAFPAAENITQIPPQQRSAQGVSEPVKSNVQDHPSYQPGPIDSTTTNSRSSRAGTLPPSVQLKLPLSASSCIICDSQQATVQVEAGAFCDECWAAAHQAAGNAPSAINVDVAAPKVVNGASNGDNGGSDSPLDHITTGNMRRNRHVHFEVPQSSSATRDDKVDENGKNSTNRADLNDDHQPGKPTQASEKQAQPLQGPEANVLAPTTSMQEGRRNALSSQSRATADKVQDCHASISHRLDVATKESSFDHGRCNSKDHLSANNRSSAFKKEFPMNKPRYTSRKKSAELKRATTEEKTKVDDRKSVAKEISSTDKPMNATKGAFCVEDMTSSVFKPKNTVEGNSSVSISRSAMSRPEDTTKKDFPASELRSAGKGSVPESQTTTKTAKIGTSRVLRDPTSAHIRKCEASLLLVCDYCSDLPATLTSDVGVFCDHCWDTAIQAEADRGVLTKPADLVDLASVKDTAAQKRVKKARRVSFVVDEARPEQSPHHISVEAAVEQRTCRCRGRPAIVEVSDVGTLCQNCLGHVAKVEKAA